MVTNISITFYFSLRVSICRDFVRSMTEMVFHFGLRLFGDRGCLEFGGCFHGNLVVTVLPSVTRGSFKTTLILRSLYSKSFLSFYNINICELINNKTITQIHQIMFEP